MYSLSMSILIMVDSFSSLNFGWSFYTLALVRCVALFSRLGFSKSFVVYSSRERRAYPVLVRTRKGLAQAIKRK